jgi:hypothetical protein
VSLGRLRGLRKDNTGYDLKQLFIGAEGHAGHHHRRRAQALSAAEIADHLLAERGFAGLLRSTC